MRVDIVFPVLPPSLDGIGDYTACLARALRKDVEVRIHTAEPRPDGIEGVEILRSFKTDGRRGINELAGAVLDDPPDWLVTQFNQFSYGKWGLNPFLPSVLKKIKKNSRTSIAVMAHEDFVPVTSLKFAVMTLWQRRQFYSLGRNADVFFLSIDPWVRRYAPKFRGTPVYHLPVGSNIPFSEVKREAAKWEAGLGGDSFAVGVFGTLGASRMMDWIAGAAKRIRAAHPETVLLYVGPDVAGAERLFDGVPLVCTGVLPADLVARRLRAMDLHLAPFIDGVSTRRGSFLAGLRNEIASLSTAGPLTDDMMKAGNGSAFLLADLPDRASFTRQAERLAGNRNEREAMACRGREFFEEAFSWDVIARRMLGCLRRHT